MSNTTLTKKELQLVNDLGDWWNQLVALPSDPSGHPSQNAEAAVHIHALQRLIMARLARRAHPETFSSISIFNPEPTR